MSIIKKGDWLVYPNSDGEGGFVRAVVYEVTADIAHALGPDNEPFRLDRRELEEHGFAPNGSPHDLIFTLEGHRKHLEMLCAALRAEEAVVRGLGVN